MVNGIEKSLLILMLLVVNTLASAGDFSVLNWGGEIQ